MTKATTVVIISLNLEKKFIMPTKIILSWISYISIINGAIQTWVDTNPNI